MTALQRLIQAPLALYCVLAFIVTAEIHSADDKEPVFTVVCPIPEKHESHAPMKFAFQSALEALGYKLNWQQVSPARAFHAVNHNNADAICVTTQLTLKFYDEGSGRPLETVLGVAAINGWTLNPDISITAELMEPNSKWSTGYLKNHTGDFLLRSRGYTQGIPLRDVSMAAKMMLSQRLDVMLLVETSNYEETLLYWMERQKIGTADRLRHREVAKILYTPYLHERQNHLRQPLEREFKELLDSLGGPISRTSVDQWRQAADAH